VGSVDSPFPEEEIMQPTLNAPPDTRASAVHAALVHLVPALVGGALLFLIGFVPYPAVHDAFHDVRHTAGFPCH
jgi:cobalt transporter subunit CbtB